MAAYEIILKYSELPIDEIVSVLESPDTKDGFEHVEGELTLADSSSGITYHCNDDGMYLTSSMEMESIFKQGIEGRPDLIVIDAGSTYRDDSRTHKSYTNAISVIKKALDVGYLPKNIRYRRSSTAWCQS